MALGAAVFLPATFLTKAEPMDHLVHFYLQTRPLGWWGPVRAEAIRRGLLVEEKRTAASAPRPLVRRTWTAEEADGWSREDWIAIVLSPVIMGLGMVGAANLFLGRSAGAWQLALGTVLAVVMFWVIDPKLRAVSSDYEARQAQDLERLEQRMRWQAEGGPTGAPLPSPEEAL
jgi:hypothetical protein